MKTIGIDLGTSNTLVYAKGRGIILREPSVVAVESKTKNVVAVGSEAKLMLGKTPGSIVALHPLKDGVIAEFDGTAAMLSHYFKKASGTTIFSHPRVIVCIPNGVTGVERRAVEDVSLAAGAGSVGLIDEPLAAAIGSGLRVEDVRGSMIIDIGAALRRSRSCPWVGSPGRAPCGRPGRSWTKPLFPTSSGNTTC